MYFKKIWTKMGIKKKIFLVSTSILVITSIFIYIILFSLFPTIYKETKINDINNKTQVLIQNLETNENFNFIQGINDYFYENGAIALLLTENNEMIYSPSKVGVERKREILKTRNFKAKNNYEFTKNIYVKSLGQECKLKIDVPLGITRDVNKVLVILFPIILIITIVLGILSVWIYGIVISNPLLEINKVAKEIANLNFKESIEIKGDDEFAELSRSINSISANLKKNIEMLEKANLKLKTDIEKEKLLDVRRRNFINAISHELKTPITAISGQLEGMIYNIGKYKDRDLYLKETLNSVIELNSLVYEIINLAKIEETLVKKEPVNLNNLIKEILDGYTYFITEKEIEIILDEKTTLEESVDVKIIRKILSNILGNSIKYSESFIKINIEKNYITVMNDTNIIFTKEEESEIFKAFYRVDKSRNKEKGGTGLGLYIVKMLIELHKNIGYKVDITEKFFKLTIFFQ